MFVKNNYLINEEKLHVKIKKSKQMRENYVQLYIVEDFNEVDDMYIVAYFYNILQYRKNHKSEDIAHIKRMI